MTGPDKDPEADAPTGDLRRVVPGVIDQRQQQIDPAGKHRVDPDKRSDSNTKQPGGSDLNTPGAVGGAVVPPDRKD